MYKCPYCGSTETKFDSFVPADETVPMPAMSIWSCQTCEEDFNAFEAENVELTSRLTGEYQYKYGDDF